jgi:mono/diheme cytochrome c family protein
MKHAEKLFTPFSSLAPTPISFNRRLPPLLLARTLVIAIVLGAAASLGFEQPANDSAASTYKTNCVSCHGADGRGSPVGKSLHAADFHSVQVKQQSDAQLATVIAEGRGNMPPFGVS